jgi:isoaspartyl peptidase/L-asparaginase-like protein (Ntn-hydrolase superfamily)
MTPPLILSTWSFGKRGNDAAWPGLRDGGGSIDAVELAARTVEADPEVDSVGFGGLPDRDGNMSLDACIMLSPSRCGSVCAVRRFMHPISIARAVMERTAHIMLAGEGADEFAAACGFQPAQLVSEGARAAWEKWKESRTEVDQSRDREYVAPRPVDREGGALFGSGAGRDVAGVQSEWNNHDTIGVLAIDRQGVMAGACSTSGTPYKVPGRVGDSPIIGHGLYVDPEAGAAVATGTGELIMSVCGTFLAVERMRLGDSALDAITHVLRRIAATHGLLPQHQVALIALRPDGAWAGAALRRGFKVSVASAAGSEAVDPHQTILPD